jgi:gliding motility-associated-like protein
VYNGDFEIYDTCPDDVSAPFPGFYQIEHCLGWYSPTYATPDYFNTCAEVWPFIPGVPLNLAGYQIPKSGNGYLGFLAFDYTITDTLGTIWQWREYIQSELVSPLVTGRIYSFTFYVSLSDDSPLACSKIGMWFTDYAYTTNDSKPIPFAPQIMNVAGNYITDTVNWTIISGSFEANGGEKYITIGPYDDEINVDTIRVLFPAEPFGWAYYYLDGCTLIDITDSINSGTFYVPNIFSPNNDGSNDILFARGTNIKEIEFSIYNRWGELVFETNDINIGWDGKYNSKPCDASVFAYYAKVVFTDGSEQIKKGSITLIR